MLVMEDWVLAVVAVVSVDVSRRRRLVVLGVGIWGKRVDQNFNIFFMNNSKVSNENYTSRIVFLGGRGVYEVIHRSPNLFYGTSGLSFGADFGS